MEVVISDDEPEIIEHHPQQEVQQLQQQQQLHPHELSLQDRLRNLAGNISISNSFNLLNEKLNFMSGRRSDVNRVNDWAIRTKFTFKHFSFIFFQEFLFHHNLNHQ